MKQYFWRGEETGSLLGLGQVSYDASCLHQSTSTKIFQTPRPGQNNLLWLKQEWHLEIKSGLRQSTRHQGLSLFIRILSQRLSWPTVLIWSRAAVLSGHHKFLGAQWGTKEGNANQSWSWEQYHHGIRCWPVGQFPSSPVGKRESDGLQGGSLAVASGEFCDCIRRPHTSSWEGGGCSLHLSVFPLSLLATSDLCRRTYRKRSISHLITVPDFAAAFTHLSKVLSGLQQSWKRALVSSSGTRLS